MKRSSSIFDGKKALLLDMNSTFMFGEDRFGSSEDYFEHYSTLEGTLSRPKINSIIRGIYEYLSARYPDEKYRHHFPSVEQALSATSDQPYDDEEIQRIVATFAHYELGSIPTAHAHALCILKQRFILGAVIDIWSPKTAWLETFRRSGVHTLFAGMSFSSDHGMVKPSPKPFELVLNQLNIPKTQAVVVGDSPRRDLGGAKNAGIDCILVGGAAHHDALGHFSSLLELSEHITWQETTEASPYP